MEKPEPLTTDFLNHTSSSSLDAFKSFFTNQLENRIVTKSKLYAGQGHVNICFEDIYTELSIILLRIS